MTLITSCATNEYIIQVSDRRLTGSDGSFIDTANKAVIFNGHTAFSYTGLAHIGGVATDIWLTNILSQCKQQGDAVETIRKEASESIKKSRVAYQYKNLAFVQVGWAKLTKSSPLHPFICVISNFHNKKWQQQQHAQDEFVIMARPLIHMGSFGIYFSGQDVPPNLRREIAKQLLFIAQKTSKKQLGGEPVARVIFEAMRKLASRNKFVSSELIQTIIPKEAVLKNNRMVSVSFSRNDQITCLYYPANSEEGVSYAPNYVSNGSVMTDIKFGSLEAMNKIFPPPKGSDMEKITKFLLKENA